MSGSGHAASAAARPSGVVMSQATQRTRGRPLRRDLAPAARRSVGFGARDDRDVDAFARERLGAAAPEPLAGRADERASAGDAEVHRKPSVSAAAAVARRRAPHRMNDGGDRHEESTAIDEEHLAP